MSKDYLIPRRGGQTAQAVRPIDRCKYDLSMNYRSDGLSRLTASIWIRSVFLIALVLQSVVATSQPNPLKLWYYKPAAKWTDALPLGNSRIGAMVFGGVKQDRIQFNEETLWTGGPREYNRPGAYEFLGEIRRLISEGRQADAEKLAGEKFMGMKSSEGEKTAWLNKVRSNHGMNGDPSLPGYDDSKWKRMRLPAYDGWESVGFDGLDGSVWLRTTFDLPEEWKGKDLILDLNRIRDHDFTYLNGKLIGTTNNTDPRKYIIPANSLVRGSNTISIQVLNYFDKGGLVGYKDTTRPIAIYPERNEENKISLVKEWKYFIQDENPPPVGQYQAAYQPFGDLFLNFYETEAKDYRRELDITTAISKTSYTVNGVGFTREYFISHTDNTMVVHLTTDRSGSLNFEAELSSPHKNFVITKIDGNTIAIAVKVRNGELRGQSYLRIVASNNSIRIQDGKIIIRHADEATLYLTAATNFKNYKDISADPALLCRRVMNNIKPKSFAQIRNTHVNDYQKYFNTLSLNLGRTSNEDLPTDQRIEKFATSSDPSLVALYLQYGRYLLISSSRPGTQPANLQGIWNDLITPPWGSKYTSNINLEMNYWPAEALNLSAMHEPLFKMAEELSVAGKHTAKVYYNAPGWILHHNTDLWRGTAPINASNHGIWQGGSGWVSHHLWEHYQYTRDVNFLRTRAYPVMKEAARFYDANLVKDPKTGWFISSPSNSPEQGGLVAGPAMDHQIIRELFKNVIKAAIILNIDQNFRNNLRTKLGDVAPDQIGKHGQLQEWLEDKDDPKNKHRHVSHLWAVYPGGEINWETPELMKAARQSLIYRGDEATGWSLGWKINFWARFKDGDHAFKLIKMLISPAEKGGAGSYRNLFDAHPPFQIDGNFGGAAGIGELLVQSHTKFIDLLPALPSALPYGEVKGICARGGFVFDIKWNNGKLEEVEFLSKAGEDCALRYNNKVATIKTQKGKRYKLNDQLVAENILRQDIPLDKGWKTVADEKPNRHQTFEKNTFNDKQWLTVDVPHNWDAYEGYRRMRHGNRHGYAWYRKSFDVETKIPGKRYFLFFEGVGSYATVWVNGRKVGYHAGGRTTFTIDVTSALQFGKQNLLAVRADHPSGIKDLPWVCGGCSDERGFSEGSQPMGIFRPVHLIVTDEVRIEPFGVHIWNDANISDRNAKLFFETEIRNHSTQKKTIVVSTRLVDKAGVTIAEKRSGDEVMPGKTVFIKHEAEIPRPHLWSVDDPYLYDIVSQLIENGKIVDEEKTPYGIRHISWPVGKAKSSNQFLLNGKAVFINGVAEYEHLIGKSHAFSAEQIRSRVMHIDACGFNGFRDAHHPHNLRYNNYWDSLGILWWTQMSAHVWYDNPEFRKNFKQLLKEWVKERRNSPSVVLWGLQNESRLPADFAKECTEIIRQLDPTTSTQRLVTTCNGGEGTDWDVPQNWTGTYGGDPATYSEDVKRQVLIGEYGAWRTLDLHSEEAGRDASSGLNSYSEDRMTRLMEQKVRLAEAVKDSTSGHFMWLLTSHDNPGRVQGGEGYRELDRIGPVNYKGLMTPWEEPLDVYYMYRSNYSPKDKQPMVYIVSHTWPGRWTKPGKKDGVVVYSNCDEVELFNDVRDHSLGKRKRQGIGTHFQWDGVDIKYNVLYAVGYVNGKEVANDKIVLYHLPQAPGFNIFYQDVKPVLLPHPDYNYIYRVNCGGGKYIDEYKHTWMADRERSENNTWGSLSWTNDHPGLPAYFASQRSISDPINGVKDWKLFQDFRYGREKLKYVFPLPDGEYLVELYFTEPWLGRGGGMDCTGMRAFDIAINDDVVLKDLDLWSEAGYATALKKSVIVQVSGGQLVISFPRVAAGQAVLSAIAIASLDKGIKPAPASTSLIHNLTISSPTDWSVEQWANIGDEQFGFEKKTFRSLPPALHGSEWIKTAFMHVKMAGNAKVKFNISKEADVFVSLPDHLPKAEWLSEFVDTKEYIEDSEEKKYTVYKKRFPKNALVQLEIGGSNEGRYNVFAVPVSSIEPAYDLKTVTGYKAINAQLEGSVQKGMVDGKERAIFSKASEKSAVVWNFTVGVADTYSLTITYNNPHAKTLKGKLQLFAVDGTLMKEEMVEFTPTRQGKSNYINSTTGSMINAGTYKVRLTSKEAEGISINSLDVQ